MTFALLCLALAAAETPKMVVLELAAGSGVEPGVTAPLTEALTAEVQRRGYFEVLSTRDIQSLLGIERQKELLGCSDATKSCMTELSGALGARFALTGSLARLGEAWQLTLTALDTQKAQPLGRATRVARTLEALRATFPYAVAEATGTPLPPPPSRALPYSLIGVGAGAAVFGLVWGTLHLSQEQQLATALDTAGGRPQLLGSLAGYQAQLKYLEAQRYVAGATLGAGLVALLVGVLVMPADTGAGGGVALVPTGNGVSLVGVFR